jgi:heme-degrading monooxygenase HmoA
MYQVIVFHYAEEEHVDEFLRFMGRVTDAVAGADGLIEFTTWREPGSGRLVAVSRWTSADAFAAARPRVMSLADQRRPEWSARPDELVATESVDR